jgi:hypothetical protein
MKFKLSLLAIITGLTLVAIFYGLFRFNFNESEPVANPPASEYSTKIVKANNSAFNCYIATGGVVYNLGSYLQKRPELSTTICGQIDPDLKAANIKISNIMSYKIGILTP